MPVIGLCAGLLPRGKILGCSYFTQQLNFNSMLIFSTLQARPKLRESFPHNSIIALLVPALSNDACDGDNALSNLKEVDLSTSKMNNDRDGRVVSRKDVTTTRIISAESIDTSKANGKVYKIPELANSNTAPVGSIIY